MAFHGAADGCHSGGTMNALATISRLYTLNNVQRDARKFMKKKGLNKAWKKAMDRDALLHRMGLTTYSPTKNAIGGISLFIAGCVVGGIAGILLAPKRGEELRRDISERTMHRQRGEYRHGERQAEYHA